MIYEVEYQDSDLTEGYNSLRHSCDSLKEAKEVVRESIQNGNQWCYKINKIVKNWVVKSFYTCDGKKYTKYPR